MIYFWRYKLRKLTTMGRKSYHGLHLSTSSPQHLLEQVAKAVERGRRKLVLELDAPAEMMDTFASYLVYGQNDAHVFLREVTLQLKPQAKKLLEVTLGERDALLTLNSEGISDLAYAFAQFEKGEYHWAVVDPALEREGDQWLTVHPFPKRIPNQALGRFPYD